MTGGHKHVLSRRRGGGERSFRRSTCRGSDHEGVSRTSIISDTIRREGGGGEAVEWEGVVEWDKRREGCCVGKRVCVEWGEKCVEGVRGCG